MLEHLTDRARHFRSMWREGLLQKAAGVLWSVYGIFAAWRQEVVKSEDQAKLGVLQVIPHLSLAWWLFGFAVVGCAWIFEASFRQSSKQRRRIADLEGISPLKIIFDSTNPNRRFWSLENNKNADGTPAPGSHWEYRAVIKNTHYKTIRNVRVTVEAIGSMPVRPQLSPFDIIKGTVIDLNPNEEQLVVIRTWWNPKIVVGMVCGTDAYGPIKMTASADDIIPTTKLFHFDPEMEPMVWEFSDDELKKYHKL